MRSRLAVVAATFVLFTAACGGDDSSGSSGDETTAEEGGSRDETNAAVVSGLLGVIEGRGGSADQDCMSQYVAQLPDADVETLAANPDPPGEELTEAGKDLLTTMLAECATS